MKILGLDISSISSGWALLEEKKNKVKIKAFGSIRPKAKLSVERMIYFKNDLENIMYTYKPDLICIEDLNHLRNKKTFMVLSSFVGQAKMLAYSFLKKEPTMIEPTAIKKFAAGKGNAEKEEVFLKMKEKYKLEGLSLDMPDALDISDAVSVCHYVFYNQQDKDTI